MTSTRKNDCEETVSNIDGDCTVTVTEGNNTKRSRPMHSSSSIEDSHPSKKSLINQDNDSTILQAIVDVGKKVDKTQSSLDELTGQIHEIRVENERLKIELERMKRRQSGYEDLLREAYLVADTALSSARDTAQYARRKNCKIIGLPEDKNESAVETEKKVISFFLEKLKIDITENDIELCHRLKTNKKTNDSNALPSTVIVRFQSRKVKLNVMKSKKLLKGQKIFIVDDLTPYNYSILTETKRHENTDRAWANYMGVVFAKTKDGRFIVIKNRSDIALLGSQHTSKANNSPQHRPIDSHRNSSAVSSLQPSRPPTQSKGDDQLTQIGQYTTAVTVSTSTSTDAVRSNVRKVLSQSSTRSTPRGPVLHQGPKRSAPAVRPYDMRSWLSTWHQKNLITKGKSGFNRPQRVSGNDSDMSNDEWEAVASSKDSDNEWQ